MGTLILVLTSLPIVVPMADEEVGLVPAAVAKEEVAAPAASVEVE